MSEQTIVHRALLAVNMTSGTKSITSLSGGCIHDVRRIDLHDGRTIVAKCAHDHLGTRQLRSEHVSLGYLESLGLDEVVIPRLLGFHQESAGAVLLMDWLEIGPATENSWRRLGEGIASMHAIDVGPRFGFPEDNFIGGTPQINTWSDDWIHFNRSSRLTPQIRMASDHGRIDSAEVHLLNQVIDRLDDWLPPNPRPSLLHGDLWSGNVVHLQSGQVAIIDPACSIGDGWADIAMLQLFGGIPHSCLESYASSIGQSLEDMLPRLDIYQMYHLLNHVNLFGRSYVDQLMKTVRRLLSA